MTNDPPFQGHRAFAVHWSVDALRFSFSLRLKWVLFANLLASALRLWAGEPVNEPAWRPLFNGTNLDGWYIVIRSGRSVDPDHLVQVEDGAIHMYKNAAADSPQPAGYIVTDKEYGDYHLRLEYKWGTKRFAPRVAVRRDAGLLYHVVGDEGVWPRSVECQIQENDVGDVFTVRTRVAATVDSRTTNLSATVTTNAATGVVRTNRDIKPVFLEPDQGGVCFIQGVADGIRRVIRDPMNEREGWNTVEVVVRGDSATYIVNGKVNNRVSQIQEMADGRWIPLRKGKIALQLEYAEVYYRNVQIRDLGE